MSLSIYLALSTPLAFSRSPSVSLPLSLSPSLYLSSVDPLKSLSHTRAFSLYISLSPFSLFISLSPSPACTVHPQTSPSQPFSLSFSLFLSVSLSLPSTVHTYTSPSLVRSLCISLPCPLSPLIPQLGKELSCFEEKGVLHIYIYLNIYT